MTVFRTAAARFIFIVAVVALCLKAGGYVVLAQDATGCNLNQAEFDELASVQTNPSLDFLEEIRAELKIRRGLLLQTVLCAIKEADELRLNLNQAPTINPDAKQLQEKLGGQIEDALNYYKLQKSKINDLGIQGSKDFAKELRVWRESNYKPLSLRIFNFIIWSKNQDIIQTAQNRINQINRAVVFLRLIDNEEIQNLFKDAETSFGEALSENQAALNSIREFGTPADSLGHIKTSLEGLALTYQKFFELSEAIGKLLHTD